MERESAARDMVVVVALHFMVHSVSCKPFSNLAEASARENRCRLEVTLLVASSSTRLRTLQSATPGVAGKAKWHAASCAPISQTFQRHLLSYGSRRRTSAHMLGLHRTMSHWV
eukprot:5723775-Amphidinium_carterae.1